MTKADRLSAALDGFLAVTTDVEAAAIVSSDGLPIASALPVDVQEDRLAAMSAALLTLGEKAAEGLGRGELAQVFVEGESGYVVLMAAGEHAVLVCVTSKDAKVGLVLFEMRRAAGEIKAVMDEPAAQYVDENPPAEAVEVSDAPNQYAPEGARPVDAYIPEAVASPEGESEHRVANWQ